MKRDLWWYILSAACGAAVWIIIAQVSGRREAWDSGLYFSAGIPAVCMASMAFGFLAPRRSWRWGITPLAGQFIWMLLAEGPGNLLPLGMVVFAVLSIPAVITARIGAYLGTRRVRRES